MLFLHTFCCPLGKLFHTNMMLSTRATCTHQRSSRLLPSCYYNITDLYHGGGKVNRRGASSKCTNKVAVLDCSHLKPPNVRENAADVNTLTAARGKPVEREFRASCTGVE